MIDKVISFKKIGRVPRPVFLFGLKAIVLFLVWKALYLGYFQPRRILDGPLTYSVGMATTVVLNWFEAGKPFSVQKASQRIEVEGGVQEEGVMDIYLEGRPTLRVADACNGLELMVLYVGFLVCFPAPAGRKWKFALIGTGIIYLLNVIRCVALVQIFLHYHPYLDFSHHFAFTFIVYSCIFGMWYSFTKNRKKPIRPV